MSNLKLKILGFFSLGLIVFFGFVLPRQNWFFFGDDYGAIYAGQKGCRTGVGQFFKSYTNEATALPSNFEGKKNSFFSTDYRPFLLIIYSIEYFFFGDQSAWPYFLIAILFHALSAALLFLLFSQCFWTTTSFLMAICFGFYPIMGRFIGRLSIQSYSINLILAILCILFFLKYFEKGKAYFLVLGGLIFAISVFVIENLFFMPVMFFLPVLFCQVDRTRCFRCIKFGLALSMGSLAYIFAKFLAFPIFGEQTSFAFVRPTKLVLANWLTLATDTFAMTGIPEGNALLKLFILIFFVSILAFGFLISQRKRNYIGLFFAFILVCWPAIIFQHGHRYLYFSTPIFLFALALAFDDLRRKISDKFFACFRGFIFGLIMFAGFVECNESLCAFEVKAGFTQKNLKLISKKLDEAERGAILVAMPSELFPLSCIAQAIWLFSGIEKPIFYDNGLNCQSTTNNTVYFWPKKENLVDLDFKNNVLTLSTRNSEKLWFGKSAHNGRIDTRFGIGQILDLGVDGQNKLKSIKVKISREIIAQKPIFVSWDYEKSRVLFLDYFKNRS